MKLTLTDSDTQSILARLAESNQKHSSMYPGDSSERQPVHTVYGGANLFKAGAAQKLGGLAQRALNTYAPDFCALARIVGMTGSESLPATATEAAALGEAVAADPVKMKDANPAAWLAYTVYDRVLKKLSSEPIEDSRIDFEDGYGNRPDDEEDADAVRSAEEVAKGMEEGTLPPFIGIRIKTFTEECRERSVRTLDLFLTRLAEVTGGKVPENFIITLPKVTHPEQVSALADLLDILEEKCGYAAGSLKLEIMIETTQAIIDADGSNQVRLLAAAARGRCRSAIFGTYDYTATCNITAAHQTHTHPASDFARHVLQVACAGTGLTISDGATTVMPIGPHKGELTNQQVLENTAVVHSAWKLHYDNIQHSLRHAYYQGWDLNPGQLPIRYAAVYAFFLEGLPDASKRLEAFINKAAQATLVGNTFDDAATGQGLLNFFLRGIACGAITQQEAIATGITMDELKSRSFVHIVSNRAQG
ncbi:MAG: phosphoenolpyruvate kinase [Pseudomonadales bacterium]|jgi:citrate lyase beta subunit|nr:phosphoenolpyruvate kinase [Pseudomonadales bacterium]MBI28115.1 phosphoenolpyruvate kinase [Pseudomonadales bacterium]MEC8810997.1 phosphoenolpyruvate kinase [Pseudomonadota bacterium]HBO95201.1 phosphoenolpyruvate kinase [Gammaproteobacteria bacterium]|tara:strand:+ start:5322 stop:6752 length:1431 start_codon:yes stop_codon:yes gene_type:complete